ncbi:MAG: HAD family hydrolase [Nanoarchaeota archaeon]
MAEKIKAYIFDLCETLIHFPQGRELKDVLGADYHEFLLAHKFSELELPPEVRERFLDVFGKSEFSLYDDSEDVIARLKGRYKLGIVSNLYEIVADKIRKKFHDFLKNFNVIALSFELGLVKPDHKIFQYALSQLGVKPEEAVMVGDSVKRDITPARELNIPTILIDRIKQNLIDLI